MNTNTASLRSINTEIRKLLKNPSFVENYNSLPEKDAHEFAQELLVSVENAKIFSNKIKNV